MNEPRTTLDEQGFAVANGYIEVYTYSEATGEYAGKMDAYTVIGTGIPGLSTLSEPPEASDKQAAVWDGNAWRIEEDHRGETVYSTENQLSFEVTELGPYPSGFTPEAPSSPFDKWDGHKWVLDEAAQKKGNIEEAENKKSALRYSADAAIAPLQDAVDLDMATDEEIALLKQWKTYRVLLNRVDTSTAPDISWPALPA